MRQGRTAFEIDPATYQAAVDREAANLATARAVKLQAEASLDRVQKDLDRYDKLIRTGAISVKNLTDAQQNLKEMQAALEQAEAGIKQAEASLETPGSILTAPKYARRSGDWLPRRRPAWGN